VDQRLDITTRDDEQTPPVTASCPDGLTHLTFTTWLAPSLPLALFERVGASVSQELGVPVRVLSETKLSGPVLGAHDPFSDGEVDVGFLCAPAYAALSKAPEPSVVSLGLAPLFDDPRHDGRPRCFCDLVVRADDPARSLADLEGRRFGSNDPASLSGWLGVSDALRRRGTTPEAFFGAVVWTGDHLSSLQAIRARSIDVASLDSNALLLARRRGEVSEDLRVLRALGPWPAQPVVARRDLSLQSSRVGDTVSTQVGQLSWFVGLMDVCVPIDAGCADRSDCCPVLAPGDPACAEQDVTCGEGPFCVNGRCATHCGRWWQYCRDDGDCCDLTEEGGRDLTCRGGQCLDCQEMWASGCEEGSCCDDLMCILCPDDCCYSYVLTCVDDQTCVRCVDEDGVCCEDEDCCGDLVCHVEDDVCVE
jgi:hypothetical protein